jgi:hypothetical protein
MMADQARGFRLPRENWFRLPNEWTDITAGIDSLAELKVIEYVLRHTWGYQEYGEKKRITIDEFMRGRRKADGTRMDKGTGLSEQSVRNGLARALADGWLEETIDDRDKARIKKSYGLVLLAEVQTLDPGPQRLDPGALNAVPRSEKDTSRQKPKEVTVAPRQHDKAHFDAIRERWERQQDAALGAEEA